MAALLPKQANFRLEMPYLKCISSTLSSLQTKQDTIANSVDPDETARYCLPFCYCFLTQTPICNNGCFRIQRWKSSFQKLRDERVSTKHIMFWKQDYMKQKNTHKKKKTFLAILKYNVSIVYFEIMVMCSMLLVQLCSLITLFLILIVIKIIL